MTIPSLDKALLERIHQLAENEQRRVLEFADALAQSRTDGEPGQNLLKCVGSIPFADLKEMQEAIQEGCEKTCAV